MTVATQQLAIRPQSGPVLWLTSRIKGQRTLQSMRGNCLISAGRKGYSWPWKFTKGNPSLAAPPVPPWRGFDHRTDTEP